MADANDRTNLSNAVPRLVAPDLLPSEYKPPVSVQKINQALDKKSNAARLEFPIDRPKYFLSMEVSDYARAGPSALAKLDKFATVILPIPMQLEDAHGVIYTQEEIGYLGAAVAQAAQTAKEKTVGGAVGSAASAGSLVAAGVGRIAFDTANFASRGVVGQIAGGVNSLYGIAPNQFMTVLLKGPAYKKFSFQWKLAPRNEEESKIIYNIIQFINDEMSPSMALGGLFWQFPSIFRLAFSNESKMYKFKPAVLESMSVNYTGSGAPAFYKSGYPESYIVVMNFLEMEFWLKGQFPNSENHPRPGVSETLDYLGEIWKNTPSAKSIADEVKKMLNTPEG